MRHGVALRSVLAAGRYRLTGQRAPLSVWLSVTTRCDALCATCATPLRKTEECSTETLVELIDGLARRGTARVVLTGGEPLLREDIGVIVDRCAGHGMYVELETNGHENKVRTELECFINWHGGSAAKFAGLIVRGTKNATPIPSPYRHGLATQRRILPLLDGSIEAVHVDVDDFSQVVGGMIAH